MGIGAVLEQSRRMLCESANVQGECWSGDGTYYLPARQVEPYRLWFEFLKQAHRDAEIQIDHTH